jgi:ribosome-associated protein
VSDELEVNDALSIPRSELEFRATRSGGPGGQHVNTSSTRIELLWNLHTSRALSDEQREHLRQRLASRTDGDGFVRVVSSEFRSQLRNREAAETRLAELLRRALVKPRKRIPTRPSRAAREARLKDKRMRSEKKRMRRGEEG